MQSDSRGGEGPANAGRRTAGDPVLVDDADPFDAYRFIGTSVRDGNAANSVQFAEIQLNGQVVDDGVGVPEPACWALALLTLSMLAVSRRRAFALRPRG